MRKRGGARGSDPSTSHEAADFDPSWLEGQVLWAVDSRKHNGANWSEQEWILTQKLGREARRQSLSPRWTKLEEKGLIERRFLPGANEPIKRPGDSKRNQIVWFITPAGEALVKISGVSKSEGPSQ